MLVRDAMNTDVVTAEPGTPIGQVARRMADADVGAVVIVESGRPVGIVTDRDLVVEHLAKGHTEEHPVSEAMSGGGPLARLVTIAPDLDLLEAAQELGRTRWGAYRLWTAAVWWGCCPPATSPSSSARRSTDCWPRARRRSNERRRCGGQRVGPQRLAEPGCDPGVGGSGVRRHGRCG